jgi:heme-degrading monooxygenase HmoA
MAPRYARIGVWSGTGDELDRWAAAARETVRPRIEQLPGAAGALFLLDRAAGRALTVTLWESEEARDASETFRAGSQQRSADASGAAVRTERYDIIDGFLR